MEIQDCGKLLSSPSSPSQALLSSDVAERSWLASMLIFLDCMTSPLKEGVELSEQIPFYLCDIVGLIFEGRCHAEASSQVEWSQSWTGEDLRSSQIKTYSTGLSQHGGKANHSTNNRGIGFSRHGLRGKGCTTFPPTLYLELLSGFYNKRVLSSVQTQILSCEKCCGWKKAFVFSGFMWVDF